MTAATPVVTPVSKTLSVASLVLGIVSIVFGFTFVVPLLAIILGAVAARREPTGRAFSVWGIVLGAICMLGWVIAVIIIVLVAAVKASGDVVTGLAQWL